MPAAYARNLTRGVVLATGIGLVAGGLHGLVTWCQRYGLGRLTWHSRDVIWMAPLANAAIFGALALLALAPALLLWKRIPASLTAGSFGFLGLFTLLLPFGGLSRWAIAILAAGTGWQLARMVRRGGRRWERRIAWGAVAMALLTGGLGIIQRGVLALRRHLALNSLPMPPLDSPNVLLLIFDTVRGDDLSLYGYSSPTTLALERWAARGVVFTNAFATSSWTLPSHLSLLTGALPDSVEPAWTRPVTIPGPTLAELLASRGYRTAGFTANLGYTSAATGLARGFTEYHGYPLSLKQLFLHAPIAQTVLVQSLVNAKSPWYVKDALRRFNLRTDHLPGRDFVDAPAITDGFLRWQAGVGGRPFFAFLNYFNAHEPYRAPAEFERRFAAKGNARRRYDAAIAYLDAELDRLLQSLEARQVLERTLVIVTSDHSEQFGEHGLRGHANSLYLASLRVPLVLLLPGRIPAGVRVPHPVSLRDIPATILDLTGIDRPALPGVSLAHTWDPGRAERLRPLVISWLIQGRNPGAKEPNRNTWLGSVVAPGYHYIFSGLGAEELYEWDRDPDELVDLSRSPKGREIIRELRARLKIANDKSGH